MVMVLCLLVMMVVVMVMTVVLVGDVSSADSDHGDACW